MSETRRYADGNDWIARLISDRVVLPVILLNGLAVAIWLEQDRGRSLFYWIDYACVLFYLLEAALKIRRRGWADYWASGWCRFDLAVLAASLPLLLDPFLAGPGDVEILSALRAGRLFRLFRAMRFIPNVEHLLLGVRRALRASIGVFFALALLNVLLSIGAYALFHDLDQEHFGSPLRSAYAIFKVFTVEGWYEIPDGIARRAALHGLSPYWGHLARAYFMLAVFCGGILGVSIANAVFVDEMVTDNTSALEAEIKALRADVRRLTERG